MKLHGDENGTCTQLVLESFNYGRNFGEAHFNDNLVIPAVWTHGNDGVTYDGMPKNTYAQFILELQHLVTEFDSGADEDWTIDRRNPLTDDAGDFNYPSKDLAFVTAVTSNTQPKSEEYLKRFGFKLVGEFPSVKYDGNEQSESKPYRERFKSVPSLWVMSAREFFFTLFPNDYTGAYVPAGEIAKQHFEREEKAKKAIKRPIAAARK